VRRAAWVLVVAAAIAGRAGAIDFDYCAGAIGTDPSHPDQALREAASRLHDQLRRGLELYEENASLLGAGWLPMPGQSDAVRSKRRALWYAAVGHWLEAQREVCACTARRGLEPGLCAELAAVAEEACGLLPAQPRYIDIVCLTTGR